MATTKKRQSTRKTQTTKKTTSQRQQQQKNRAGDYMFAGFLLGLTTGVLLWCVNLISYALT